MIWMTGEIKMDMEKEESTLIICDFRILKSVSDRIGYTDNCILTEKQFG